MKIRLTTGSIRFRIGPSELEALRRGDPIEASLSLPGGDLRAEIVPGERETSIRLNGAAMTAVLGAAELRRLSEPDAEGVYFSTESDPPVRYYIEKDYPCVHPGASQTNEPQTETFATPNSFLSSDGV